MAPFMPPPNPCICWHTLAVHPMIHLCPTYVSSTFLVCHVMRIWISRLTMFIQKQPLLISRCKQNSRDSIHFDGHILLRSWRDPPFPQEKDMGDELLNWKVCKFSDLVNPMAMIGEPTLEHSIDVSGGKTPRKTKCTTRQLTSPTRPKLSNMQPTPSPSCEEAPGSVGSFADSFPFPHFLPPRSSPTIWEVAAGLISVTTRSVSSSPL